MEESESYATNFLSNAVKLVGINFQPVVVLPGEDLTEKITASRDNFKIGSGLLQIDNKIKSTIAGSLKYRAPSTYWVESNYRKYTPRTNDQVVGIIEDRSSEFYRVNIFSGSVALLNRLGFEGASKRNKPELKVGDVVYCRIALAHKDLDTELTCIMGSGSKKEWSSGETVLGGLPDGLLVRVPIGHARKMLLPESLILASLGRKIAFEVAIGMNGAIWIRSNSPLHTIIIRNVILNSEGLDDDHIEAMIDLILLRELGSSTSSS